MKSANKHVVSANKCPDSENKNTAANKCPNSAIKESDPQINMCLVQINVPTLQIKEELQIKIGKLQLKRHICN